MEWVKGVDDVAKTNLEKPLLVRGVKDSGDVLKVNFDPEVWNTHCAINYSFSIYLTASCFAARGEVPQTEGVHASPTHSREC